MSQLPSQRAFVGDRNGGYLNCHESQSGCAPCSELGEGDHLGRERRVESVRRSTLRVPMHERLGPAVDEARGEASDRAIGEAEQERRFISRDPALEEPREQLQRDRPAFGWETSRRPRPLTESSANIASTTT